MAIVPLSLLLSPPLSLPLRAVAVAAVISIYLWMNPFTFLSRADRCATVALPPAADNDDQCSVDAARDLLSGGGVRHHLLLYNSANRPTHQFCSLRN